MEEQYDDDSHTDGKRI